MSRTLQQAQVNWVASDVLPAVEAAVVQELKTLIADTLAGAPASFVEQLAVQWAPELILAIDKVFVPPVAVQAAKLTLVDYRKE